MSLFLKIVENKKDHIRRVKYPGLDALFNADISLKVYCRQSRIITGEHSRHRICSA